MGVAVLRRVFVGMGVGIAAAASVTHGQAPRWRPVPVRCPRAVRHRRSRRRDIGRIQPASRNPRRNGDNGRPVAVSSMSSRAPSAGVPGRKGFEREPQRLDDNARRADPRERARRTSARLAGRGHRVVQQIRHETEFVHLRRSVPHRRRNSSFFGWKQIRNRPIFRRVRREIHSPIRPKNGNFPRKKRCLSGA